MLKTIMKYQKYTEYKDSGINWLGKIPSHWNKTKVKYEAYVKARVGWHGLKSDDFTEEGPYLVTGSDFKGTNIDWSQCYHCDEPRYEQDPYIQLREGDLLITKDGTIGKVALVSNLKEDEKATLNSGIFVVRPLRNNFSTKFYFWLLQSKVFKEFVDFNKTGSTIVHLYQDTFVNFEYASPNLEDQIQISNFLDYETSKIDTLIFKQEKLIELLKEKYQAVISHAVTKGLNPDVVVKDSDVEWLGQVPEHWEIIKFDYVINTIGDIDHYMPSSVDIGIPYVMTGDLEDFVSDIDFENCKKVTYSDYQKLSRKIKTAKDDIIFARYATIGTLSYVDVDTEFLVSYSCVTIKPNPERITGKYLFYYLKSQAFLQAIQQQINSNTQGNVGVDSLRNVKILLPSLLEQEEIFDFLKNELSKIDSLIVKAKSTIQLMQERRIALISSAVTGKIDVRNWQHPNAAKWS